MTISNYLVSMGLEQWTLYQTSGRWDLGTEAPLRDSIYYTPITSFLSKRLKTPRREIEKAKREPRDLKERD